MKNLVLCRQSALDRNCGWCKRYPRSLSSGIVRYLDAPRPRLVSALSRFANWPRHSPADTVRLSGIDSELIRGKRDLPFPIHCTQR
jgi:hypothetical protein